GARHQRDREEGQAQLFGGFGDQTDARGDGEPVGLGTIRLADVAPWTEGEQPAAEKETLGVYWGGHPVDRYAGELAALGARASGELAEAPGSGSRADAWGPNGPKPVTPDTSIGGIIGPCRQLKTRKGERMAVFTLEDSQGGVEVIAFPETYQRSSTLIET